MERLHFARVCVEVSKNAHLPKKIRVNTGVKDSTLSVDIQVNYHSRPKPRAIGRTASLKGTRRVKEGYKPNEFLKPDVASQLVNLLLCINSQSYDLWIAALVYRCYCRVEWTPKVKDVRFLHFYCNGLGDCGLWFKECNLVGLCCTVICVELNAGPLWYDDMVGANVDVLSWFWYRSILALKCFVARANLWGLAAVVVHFADG
ncbi:hypothetical protein Nepgr_018713 [Nepenthes gracilis]|uniref:Uncharacterized protein n=1 Tax=Nepenthes gracilis TaxID=150966 RepID=A0AAD3XTA7_NEPGR|nr:hypothetical protein Nepgr_018713 [Nepenthes gracilis]